VFWNALIEIFAMGHQAINHQPSSISFRYRPQRLEGLRPQLKAVG
jgi:hypothetical protein